MNNEKMQELNDEERQEEREAPMYIWIDENIDTLRSDYLDSFTHEQLKAHLLDYRGFPGVNEFFEERTDDFNTFCKEQYHSKVEQ